MTETCQYCGSPDVLDDAWWCASQACWEAYGHEEDERFAYESRTPLTHLKARDDLCDTKASVWGPSWIEIRDRSEMIARLANLTVY
jgi:hypothetical protein